MDTTTVPKTTTHGAEHGRRCAGCGETDRALQAPRPNVGVGYKGAMFCMPCNPRFKALDFHHASLERSR